MQRSLATLQATDVLIAPALGTLAAGDFDQAANLKALGDASARGRSDRLAGLARSSEAYAV